MASGRIIDASDSGIAILIPEAADFIKGEARIHIPPAHQPSGESPDAIALRARLVDHLRKSKGQRLGFRVEQIESGASEWTQLCRAFH